MRGGTSEEFKRETVRLIIDPLFHEGLNEIPKRKGRGLSAIEVSKLPETRRGEGTIAC